MIYATRNSRIASSRVIRQWLKEFEENWLDVLADIAPPEECYLDGEDMEANRKALGIDFNQLAEGEMFAVQEIDGKIVVTKIKVKR